MINNLIDRARPSEVQSSFPMQTNEWVDPVTGEHFTYDRGIRKPIGAISPNEEQPEGHAEKSEGPLRRLAHHVLSTGFAQKHADDREPVEGLTFSA